MAVRMVDHSSAVQHLFSSAGRWIAFRQGKYVFDTDGRWIGWVPWGDGEVVDIEGRYVGTIFPNDRFYRNLYRRSRGYPGYPGYPGYLGYPGYPGYPGHSPLPPGTVDVNQLSRQ